MILQCSKINERYTQDYEEVYIRRCLRRRFSVQNRDVLESGERMSDTFAERQVEWRN